MVTLLTISTTIAAYSAQINIPRIEKMPATPIPFQMRNWKQVAIDYDNLVFNTQLTGTYLPLSAIKSSGNNYPSDPQIQLKTFVGNNQSAEAINILPALVGASLCGVDKSSHLGINWVELSKDFFNSKNGQDVYLNNYSANSGGDWWYDLMPNLYFYQLYSLYLNSVAEHSAQFITVADRWLDALYKLGAKVYPWTAPNMNHRAFNLITGKPLTSGVKEPESAGSISWLLYHAYRQTANPKYLEGAQLSLDFLESWRSNPSYELQLPYGTLIAAKMNAELGTNYNIEKLFNWCFDKGDLRQWGCIVGNWGGYDVSGLIGEAKDDQNDYGFIMNGFQQAGAMAPIAKYDKRFARAIGKWLLNLANASHLMYRTGLPESLQQPDSYRWSIENDPNSCIPYEALKEKWDGKSPYATGDAFRSGWAPTDLSLYSGSSVGYLGSIIQTTNVEAILQIDLNQTDFFCDSWPTYLYYNPTPSNQEVSLRLPSGNWNIYNTIDERIIASDVSGDHLIEIPADQAAVVVCYPSNLEIKRNGRQAIVGTKVVDYHTQYDYTPEFRIKSLYSSKQTILYGERIELYCLVAGQESSGKVAYEWYVDGVKQPTSEPILHWCSPAAESKTEIKIKCFSKGHVIEQSQIITVTNNIYPIPNPSAITLSGANPYQPNQAISATVEVEHPQQVADIVWKTDMGESIQGSDKRNCTWILPANPGVYTIRATLSNGSGSKSIEQQVLVKNETELYTNPLIYLPLNGETTNHAADRLHATLQGAEPTEDAKGEIASAYQFTTSDQIIYIDNDEALNFADKVGISCWLRPMSLTFMEQFIVSHGSWEERYKISIIPEKKLRWTVKTSDGVKDVDSKSTLQPNQYYHCYAQYTGYSIELYLNGILQDWRPLTGKLLASNKAITLARKDQMTTEYAFKGAIDELRLYDIELGVSQIATLPNTWGLPMSIEPIAYSNSSLSLSPNPARDYTIIQVGDQSITAITLSDITGKRVPYQALNELSTGSYRIDFTPMKTGIYLLQIQTSSGIVQHARLIVNAQ